MPSVNEKSKFFDIVNRGKLTAPSDQLFTVCCICYEFFCQLKSCPTFLHFVNLPNPASYFRDSILNKLKDLPVSFICNHFHDCNNVATRVIISYFNTFSRNFVRSFNNKKESDIRKIPKLTSTKCK